MLIAGNHGDEYEGKLALINLARTLQRADVFGRVIIVPSFDFPAFKAGRRLSPLDDRNLNRVFPENALGSPTEMIARYVSDVLLPVADVVIDLHFGGFSLDYVQCALIRSGRNEEETSELLELAEVFGAPVILITRGSAGGGAITLNAVGREL